MNKPLELIRRWWLLLWLRNTDPVADIRADYETLIRLARRCAYDFSHASDFIPTKDRPEIYWLPEMNWQQRSQFWIGLFAKGNPGKDYRTKMSMELYTAKSNIETLVKILRENGLGNKIPSHMLDDIPF